MKPLGYDAKIIERLAEWLCNSAVEGIRSVSE